MMRPEINRMSCWDLDDFPGQELGGANCCSYVAGTLFQSKMSGLRLFWRQGTAGSVLRGSGLEFHIEASQKWSSTCSPPRAAVTIFC